MGSGDLNLKKSWHPLKLVNVEKVWKAEQKDKNEKDRIAQLLREKEDERMREELQMQAISAGHMTTKSAQRLDWMYAVPGQQTNSDEYLLGKKIERLPNEIKAEEASLAAGSGSFMAANSAATTLDLASKIREDPMFMIKKKQKDRIMEVRHNPVKMALLKEMIEKEADKKSKKDRKREKKEKKKEKKEKHKRTESKHSDESGISDSDSKGVRETDEHEHKLTEYMRGYGLMVKGKGEMKREGERGGNRERERDRSRSDRSRDRHNDHVDRYDSNRGRGSGRERERRGEEEREGEKRRERERDMNHKVSSDRLTKRPIEMNRRGGRSHTGALDAEEKKRRLAAMQADAALTSQQRDERIALSAKRDREEDEKEKQEKEAKRIRSNDSDNEYDTHEKDFLDNVRRDAVMSSDANSSLQERLQRNRHFIQRTEARLAGSFVAK